MDTQFALLYSFFERTDQGNHDHSYVMIFTKLTGKYVVRIQAADSNQVENILSLGLHILISAA